MNAGKSIWRNDLPDGFTCKDKKNTTTRVLKIYYIILIGEYVIVSGLEVKFNHSEDGGLLLARLW